MKNIISLWDNLILNFELDKEIKDKIAILILDLKFLVGFGLKILLALVIM